MHDPKTLTAVAAQFSLACSIASLYYVVTLGEHVPEWFFPLALLPYSVVIYVVNRLFLRRERTLRSVCILNTVGGVLLLCAYLYFESWKGLSYLLTTAAFIAWLTARGGQLAYSGPNLRNTLLTLDGSFVCLLLLTAYTTYAQMGLQWSYPALCGFAAAVIAVACSRNSQPLGWKSWLVMLCAFAALFSVMGLLLGVAAAPAGYGLVTLWQLLTSAVKAVSRTLLGLLQFLLSLLPAGDAQDLPVYEVPALPDQEVPMEQTNSVVSAVLIAALLVLLAALAVWVIRRLGKIKLGGAAAKKPVSASKRTRRSFLRGLYTLVRGWLNSIRLRWYLWKNRNAPKGLYFLLVHRYRRGPWRKQNGETPREFLLRLACYAQDDPPLTQALEQLARAVDAQFYSGRPGQERLDYAPLIRHKIGAVVLRQFLRDTLSRLRPKHNEKSPVS